MNDTDDYGKKHVSLNSSSEQLTTENRAWPLSISVPWKKKNWEPVAFSFYGRDLVIFGTDYTHA